MGRMIGERVALREFRWEDLQEIRGWVTDGEITRYLSGIFLRPQTWEQTEQYLRNMLDGGAGGANFVIAEKDTLKYLGQCNLMMVDNQARKAELAVVLRRENIGRGVGREALSLLLRFAFDGMNLNRVYLKVYADNLRAIRLYEALGFVREGVLRADCYREGRYTDTLVMGLLRDEWLAARNLNV